MSDILSLEKADGSFPPIKMKPIVFLDSKLPKTSTVPVLENGEIDYSMLERLCDISTEYRYSDRDEEARRAELKVEYDALKASAKFEDRPHFVQYSLVGGALSGVPPIEEQRDMIGCHPDTWALATEEMKAKYEVAPAWNPAGTKDGE